MNKHDAINEISVIYGYCHLLRRKAITDITAEMAVEVRDLAEDLIYKIDMFEKNNVPLRRFIEDAA
jgi:hypothetical protein